MKIELTAEQIAVIVCEIETGLMQAKHVLDNHDRIIFALGKGGITRVENRAKTLQEILDVLNSAVSGV